MKLQFKHQPFQAEAAAAVCDVFRGQSLCAQAHRQGLGAAADRPLSLAGTGTGLCNQPLAPELTDARILKNLHAVHQRVQLTIAQLLPIVDQGRVGRVAPRMLADQVGNGTESGFGGHGGRGCGRWAPGRVHSFRPSDCTMDFSASKFLRANSA